MAFVFTPFLFNLTLTLIVFIAYALLRTWVVHRATRVLYKQQVHAHLVRNLLRIVFIVGLVIAVVLIWFGQYIDNVWVTLASVLGVVAIGFFAVWSILSNIVCGLIIMLLRNIEIGDDVEIVENNIGGKIEEINLFYVILSTKKGTYHVPNNVFIQKIVFKRR